MNKIKKAAFGILVAGLAFGISAFATIKKQSVITYYKVDMTYPSPSNPTGYVYFSSDRCESGGDVCTAEWNIGSNPAPTSDGTLLPISGVSFVSGSTRSGHFE